MHYIRSYFHSASCNDMYFMCYCVPARNLLKTLDMLMCVLDTIFVAETSK